MGTMNRRQFLAAASGLVVPMAVFTAHGSEAATHLVRKGDTLSELAQRYGVSVADLKRANGLESDLIRIGQRLIIPAQLGDLASVKRLVHSTRVRASRWKYIVGHHSATRHGNAEIYDKNHRRRGMENGLAYHFVIGNGVDSGDGEIEVGPRWKEQLHGGHVRKWEVNDHGIGICLVGNFEKTRPTPRQIASFNALVGYLGRDLLKNNYSFLVHKEVDRNHTVCPGRYFPVKEMHRRFN
jgi:LysM repeat protein